MTAQHPTEGEPRDTAVSQTLIYCYGAIPDSSGDESAVAEDATHAVILDEHGAADALRRARHLADGRDFALLHRTTVLPPYWLSRLQEALAAEPAAACVSPLALGTTALSPIAPESEWHATDLIRVDRLCHAFGERQTAALNGWLPALSLWRGSLPLDHLNAVSDARLPPGLSGLLCDAVCVGARGLDSNALHRYVRSAPPAVSALRHALATRDDQPELAGIDGRPVLLHILHGWGGGATRFVSDLIKGDDQCVHRVLVAHGSFGEGNGLRLCLHADLDAPALREWSLSAGIDTCAIASPEYRSILDAVIARDAVSGVLVSSLIGHGIEALTTGLPTAVVCHDYFPLWPLLHDNFDDDERDFSKDAIAAALTKAPTDWVFGEREPGYWRALRSAWMEAIKASRVALIAPSQSVRSNLLRMEPQLAAADWHAITHGFQSWPEPLPMITGSPDRQQLRIVVPGRINGGKGEDLLSDLLPNLPEGIEVVLLGCGRAGMRFFGLRNVHIQMDYRRDELPALLDQLQPDAALLPSTVPETWSYTLTEMWRLGLPVIATRLGSFAERISDAVNGLLVEPTAASVRACLVALTADRSPLANIRGAGAPAMPSLAEMAERYRDVLSLKSGDHKAQIAGIEPQLLRFNDAQRQQAEAEIRLTAANQTIASQRSEIDRRGDWGASLSRELKERIRWAEHLMAEREAIANDLRRTQSEGEEARSALEQELKRTQIEGEAARNALEQDLKRTQAEGEAARNALEQDLRRTQAEGEAARNALEQDLKRTQVENAIVRSGLEQQLTQTQQDYAGLDKMRDETEQALRDLQREFDERTRWALTLDEERTRILNSLSWRLTRPLRYARRKLGALLAHLRYIGRRIGNLRHRGLRSLKSRGVRGSFERLKQEFRTEPSAMSAPEVPTTTAFSPFALPTSDTPRISVVIPAWNHFDATLLCLKAIAATTEETPFEVILVDDCGSDETQQLAPQIDGLRFLRNEANLGFIGACNRGAKEARGEFVLFLNNDTAVQAGWLDALVATFQHYPDAGLVGSKLVYPDGRLQEAGGIVFSDASGWNYGRFDDPSKPEYNFVRDVDYCSGAAILLRRELFERLGGFDTYYAPAYYEDTDLAMKVRQQGLRVLYQPASVVVHYEGVTSGTDTDSGIKAHQITNQQKFLERWRGVLASHRAAGTDIAIARQHRSSRQVLVIDATTPQPDHDSGSVRLVNVLRILREDGCAVTFFADNRAFVPGYSEALQQLGVEVLWHPHIDPPKWIASNGSRFDLVLVSRHYIASNYLELVRLHAPKARFVFDTVDLHYLREQRAAELANRDDLRRSAEETRSRELRLIRQSDITLVVSTVEQELLSRDAPGARVDILSNVHQVAGSGKPFSERRDLVFVGGFQHPPNIDAATWLVKEIFPLVRAEDASIRLHLIGSKAGDEVRVLGNEPGVEFHGFVPDIDPYMDGCRLALAPLRYGAGVKGKVNLSMAHGQPVVATPIAVEGMFVEPGREVMVAESPADFARAVLAAYHDEALWLRLAKGGLDNVQTHFGFDSARRALHGLFDD